MICSASDFSSSGFRGDWSSDRSSPFTRVVAARPALSSRSEAFFCTSCVMAALKLNVDWPGLGAAGIGGGSEGGLSELHGLGVLHQHLAHHTSDFGLDFVHDLHGFDDAHDLARRDAAAHLDVGPCPGLGGVIKRPDHGGLDIEQVGWGGGLAQGRSPCRPCLAGPAGPPTPPPPPPAPPPPAPLQLPAL